MDKHSTKNQAIDFKQEIITTANAMRIANRIALRALKTLLDISYSEYLKGLYNGLKRYIATNYQDVSDASDILSEACIVINAFCNKGYRLIDVVEYNGKQATIARHCYYAINNYIDSQKKVLSKTIYVDEIDENGERVYIPIPKGWDVDNAADYKKIKAIIAQLKLNDTQQKILRYRLQGIAVDNTTKGKNGQPSQAQPTSTRTIAAKMGMSNVAVHKQLKLIREKAISIGLKPKTE